MSSAASGPPLLLLHGYPQTHAMWHQVAPALARPVHRRVRRPARLRRLVEARRRRDARRVLEARDGRRHGRADARRSASHASASPATIAAGASRTACASIIRRRSSASPCSTSRRRGRCIAQHRQAFATAYYHWFFLIQPFDLPERLIGADPVYYLRQQARELGHRALAHFDPRAMAEYERCFRDPATIHATCEDYRAAASIDLEHDAADARSPRRMPAARAVGGEGRRAPLVRSARRLARRRARRARHGACRRGHYLAEEAARRDARAEFEALLRRLDARAAHPRRFGTIAGFVPRPGIHRESLDGQVAQLVEQRTENPCVGGSIPPLATNSCDPRTRGFAPSAVAPARNAALAVLHGPLPQQVNLRERLGVRLHARLLLRALFPTDAGESLAQVRFDAAGVAKGSVENRFHTASCVWHEAPQPSPHP